MKRFRELIIPCSANIAATIIKGIEDRIKVLSSRWTLNERAMENTRQEHGVFAQAGPFVYVNNLSMNAMVAFLFRSDSAKQKSGLWIANIVPLQATRLSVEEYNAVLDLFSKELVNPVLTEKRISAQCETMSALWEAADKMPENCTNLLEQFASLANKHCLHPYDEARWRQFVLAAWKSGQNVDEWNLHEILEKQYDFTPEQSLILCDQFNFGIALLEESREC